MQMTIDECLELSCEWSKGITFHDGSQGWRVVCMLLSEEVLRMRAALANAPVEIAMRQAREAGANHEREACAKVCESLPRQYGEFSTEFTSGEDSLCANAIRMRSNV
jgi:hypothetical protein